MNENKDAFDNRFALYFDFLGASEAAKKWPRERLHAFVDSLKAIATIESAQNISGKAQEDGGYKIHVTPEVTTFSDHIVVSYPAVPEETKEVEPIWTPLVCQDSIRILSWVAENALRIGLLIRGGLTFGQLFHENGVVFGKALVDAYELESRTAVYPRIVVSNSVIEKLGPLDVGDNADSLLKDVDGIWHLNYIRGMMKDYGIRPKPSTPEQAKLWKQAHLDTIQKEIENIRQTTNPNVALGQIAKWEWFRNQFDAITAKISV